MNDDTETNQHMHAIVIGPDEYDLTSALEAVGITVDRVVEIATGDRLHAAGIETADLLVITDVGEATAIPIAREHNPTVRIIVYADDSLPEFAKPIADYIIDPDLMTPTVIAEELM